MFRRFLLSRNWSSAQDHAVLVLLLNLVGFFISTWPRWSGGKSVGNDLYHSCTSFEGASRGGQPLNIFTWFIGAGGFTCETFTCETFTCETFTCETFTCETQHDLPVVQLATFTCETFTLWARNNHLWDPLPTVKHMWRSQGSQANFACARGLRRISETGAPQT